MPYAIANQMALSVFIEGRELPFGEAFSLNYVHLAESTMKGVPTFALSVTDSTKWLLAASLLKDGNRVHIVLQSGDTDDAPKYAYDFRLGHFDEKPNINGSVFVLEGMLDAPSYLASTSRKPIKGTSSEVMGQIAKTGGLTYLGVGTSDTQTWYPSNLRLVAFAQKLAHVGFATDNSAMSVAVSLNKELIYRDITAMDNPVGTIGLMDLDTPGTYPAVAFEVKASPGGLNVMAGYKLTTYEQDLMGTESTFVRNADVGTVINEPGGLLMSQAVKNNGREGRVHFAPIDPGNAHASYARARHQNSRVLSLFSFQIQVVVPGLTSFKVLDTVDFDVSSAVATEGALIKSYAGAYRIVARVLYCVPGRIAEKLTLVRRTVNLPDALSSKSTPLEVSSNIIVSVQEQQNRISKVSFTVPTALGVPGFDLAKLSGPITAIGAAAAASLAAGGAGILGSVTAVNGTLSGSSVTTALAILFADIQAQVDVAVAAITAIRGGAPGSIPLEVTLGKTQVDGVIAAQQPGIVALASKASAMAGTASSVAAAASVGSSAVQGKVQAATEASVQSIRSMGSTLATALNGAAGAAVQEVVNGIAVGNAALSGALATNTATTATLLNDAATYATQINAAKVAAYSAIDAA